MTGTPRRAAASARPCWAQLPGWTGPGSSPATAARLAIWVPRRLLAYARGVRTVSETAAAIKVTPEVVRAAVDAGLSKSEVHRLAGMARTAIGRIAGTIAAMEADPR